MADRGTSRRGALGNIIYYDEKGRKIGTSTPRIFGGYTNYDEKGRKTGYSSPSLFGGYNHYDSNGRKTGYSDPNIYGGYNHYNNRGRKIGQSDPELFGSYHNSDNQGCYVATCVYGSYDCPQVWTLRRFRDNTLASTAAGRAFIYTYYAISPTLVRLLGSKRWFKGLFRGLLDNMVKRLNNKGVDNTPYKDRKWK